MGETHLKDNVELNTAIYMFELEKKNSQVLLRSTLTFKIKHHVNENIIRSNDLSNLA